MSFGKRFLSWYNLKFSQGCCIFISYKLFRMQNSNTYYFIRNWFLFSYSEVKKKIGNWSTKSSFWFNFVEWRIISKICKNFCEYSATTSQCHINFLIFALCSMNHLDIVLTWTQWTTLLWNELLVVLLVLLKKVFVCNQLNAHCSKLVSKCIIYKENRFQKCHFQKTFNCFSHWIRQF